MRMPECGIGDTLERTVPMVTAADDDQVRGNVYALLGHLLSAPPDAAVLESLAAIAPAPEGDSLLTASWQMLGEAATRATPESLRDEHTTLFSYNFV